MDLALDTTISPTPLKKCFDCGDEWITDQDEVTCLVTGNKVVLEVIDSNPIDEDEPFVPNPCAAGKHTLSSANWYRFERKNGRVEQGCLKCRRERNLAAKRRQKARKLAYLNNVRNIG